MDYLVHAAEEFGSRFHCSRSSMPLGESKGGLPPDDCVEEHNNYTRPLARAAT